MVFVYQAILLWYFLLYLIGDLAPRLIDELAALVDEVFVPLLSNPLNHEGWPLVVSQDILKQIHSLKSTVYEVSYCCSFYEIFNFLRYLMYVL